ncbi:phage tail protein [Puniceibacterium sediminis]|nr:tail fiber protein [Puniceibacterium sediminis]
MVSFNFAPRGWAFLDGQFLPINQNQSLYSLLGTTYGGDGRTTFALPDLRGRTPLHMGDGFNLGRASGSEGVALTTAEMPAHTHTAKASSLAGDSPVPTDHVLAAEAGNDLAYHAPEAPNMTALREGTVSYASGGQPHENMQPYLTVAFCIALQGLFPSQN